MRMSSDQAKQTSDQVSAFTTPPPSTGDKSSPAVHYNSSD